jgi:hypothetical protein
MHLADDWRAPQCRRGAEVRGAEPLAGTCPILSHTRQWNAPSLRKLKRTALRRRDARGAFDQGEALAMCDRIGVMNEDP